MRGQPTLIAPKPLGLGVALDMPWNGRGFRKGPHGNDHVSPALDEFFKRYGELFAYSLLAFQPRDLSHLRADAYVAAYDSFYYAARTSVRAFHQTTLNLATPEEYDRTAIVGFTNDLAARYSFAWVVEDLGIWSLDGKSLPYPLPPILTEDGIEICVRNIRRVATDLTVPLHVEFPGFTEGASFSIGWKSALDVFREVVDRSDSWATIDVGHVLGYLALVGGSLLDIERLPLDRCRELHMAGSSWFRGRFQDAHHGVLLDEQLDLMLVLIERCPNLIGVTYEDPRFRNDGALVPRSERNFFRLVELVGEWANR